MPLHRPHLVALAFSVWAAIVVASPDARAQVPCGVAGDACSAAEEVPGTCAPGPDGEVLCLADPEGACEGRALGASCPTFVADGGACGEVAGTVACVPDATDAACADLVPRDPCMVDGEPGGCVVDGGLLVCEPSACATAEHNAPCRTAESGDGWCRPLPDGGLVPVCTAECGAEGDPCARDDARPGVCQQEADGWSCVSDAELDRCLDEGDPCRLADDTPGFCEPEGEAGILGCVPECTDDCCGGCCSEGEACVTSTGEDGSCRAYGGAGSLDCFTDEEIAASSNGGGGCCLQDRNPSMASGRSALGALGFGIAAVFARRRRRC